MRTSKRPPGAQGDVQQTARMRLESSRARGRVPLRHATAREPSSGTDSRRDGGQPPWGTVSPAAVEGSGLQAYGGGRHILSTTVRAVASPRVAGEGRSKSPSSPAPSPADLRLGRALQPHGASAEADHRALRQVRSLFLSCQGIVSVCHIQDLQRMTGLRCLSLHMNLLRRVEGLEALRSLVDLDLSGNEVSSLEASCFRSQGRLRRLNLSSNCLTALPDNVFELLPSLSWLSLAFNRLSTVRPCLASIPDTAPLHYVDLCGNDIVHMQDVVDGLAAHAKHVRELRLRTPQPLGAFSNSAGSTAAEAQDDASPRNAFLVHPIMAAAAADSSALFRVRENPLCGASAACPASGDAQATKNYVDVAVESFPSLTVLDGITIGVEPLKLLRAAAARVATGTAPASTPTPTDDWVLRGRHAERGETTTNLLSAWLPHSARRLDFVAGPRATDGGNGRGDAKAASNGASAGVSPVADGEASRSLQFITPDSKDEDGCTAQPRGGGHRRRQDKNARDRRDRRGASRSGCSSEDASSTTASSSCSSTGSDSSASEPGQRRREGGSRRRSRRHPHSGSGRRHRSLPVTSNGSSPSTAARAAKNSHARPQRVSRGTTTDPDSFRGHEETEHQLASLQAQLQRAQEQLQLRLAMEADLRRHLELQEERAAVTQHERASERAQSEARLAAAKAELTRRADEVAIMKRKESAALAEQEAGLRADWQRKLAVAVADAQQAAVAASSVQAQELTDRLQQAEETSQVAESEVRQWKKEYEDLRRHCETSLTQLTAAHGRALREAAQQRKSSEALARLLVEESDGRRDIEYEAASTLRAPVLHTRGGESAAPARVRECVTGLADFYRELLQHSLLESAERAEEWQQHEETWKAYGEQLRSHYRDVLHHAETEAAQLRTQVAELKGVVSDSATAAAVRDAPSPGKDAAVQTDPRAAPVETACDPVDGAASSSALACAAIPTLKEAAAAGLAVGAPVPCVTGPAVLLPSGAEADPLLAATTYWKAVSERQHAELQRLRHALTLSEEAATAAGKETARLLEQQAEAERLRTQRESDLAEQQNLRRALHNLEADLGKKDAALDALEEAARAKIDAKRRAIAELEEKVEAAAEAQERSTAERVQLRDELSRALEQLAAATAKETAQEEKVASLRKHVDALTQQQQQQQHIPMAVQERQAYEREQARLISALSMAREQLVQLHSGHRELLQQTKQLQASLALKEKESTDAQRQLRELQEQTRLKQRATVEALSRMMLTDSV